MAEAEEAWQAITERSAVTGETFSHASIVALPEIARRYFTHAIADGTPLRSCVELQMHGHFLLGDAKRHHRFAMTAREVLRPPGAFVWMPKMRSGPMTMSGSDALVGEVSWTRFWLMGLVRVADAHGPDIVRSASFRSAMESIWVPPSLLPDNGAQWEQTGPDTAQITITAVRPEIELELVLGPSGAVEQIKGLRWSNANSSGAFQLQPFGGTVSEERTFSGFTIPSRMAVGNHFGTKDYFPFFETEIVGATFR